MTLITEQLKTTYYPLQPLVSRCKHLSQQELLILWYLSPRLQPLSYSLVALDEDPHRAMNRIRFFYEGQ